MLRLRSVVSVLASATLLVALAGCAEPKADAVTREAAPSPRTTDAPLSAAVQAQLAYVHAHWKHYNTSEYETLSDNDWR